MLPKAIYTFNAIPIKIPPTFFTELEQTIVEFVWNRKRPQIAKAIFKKKTKAGGNHTPRLQDVLQSCNHHDSMVLAQNRPSDQWKRIENPEMDHKHIAN